MRELSAHLLARGWQHRGNEDGCLGNGAPKENPGCCINRGSLFCYLLNPIKNLEVRKAPAAMMF
jgi:hypothetical protein